MPVAEQRPARPSAAEQRLAEERRTPSAEEQRPVAEQRPAPASAAERRLAEEPRAGPVRTATASEEPRAGPVRRATAWAVGRGRGPPSAASPCDGATAPAVRALAALEQVPSAAERTPAAGRPRAAFAGARSRRAERVSRRLPWGYLRGARHDRPGRSSELGGWRFCRALRLARARPRRARARSNAALKAPGQRRSPGPGALWGHRRAARGRPLLR
jgi:hypothetical protein